jgi:hypothetical protein
MAVTTENFIYARLLKQAEAQRIIPNRTQAARDWFRKKALTYPANGPRIRQENLFQHSVVTSTILPGRMYMYVYDAKTKDKLPYWDAFPLIFPIDTFPGGFYGLNMHYLPPMLRAQLMDVLYTTANNTKYDDTTRLRLSYQNLKAASRMKLFQPCFKKYLFDHVKSRFIYVEPKEWDIALFLPLQRFQKATAEQVWRDSASATNSMPWQNWGSAKRKK